MRYVCHVGIRVHDAHAAASVYADYVYEKIVFVLFSSLKSKDISRIVIWG